jgi:hypothetical protein
VGVEAWNRDLLICGACWLSSVVEVQHRYPAGSFLFSIVGGEFCLVDEVEVSENREALIVLAGIVGGAAGAFVASLRIPLEIKAPATALASIVTGAILLYLKNKSTSNK